MLVLHVFDIKEYINLTYGVLIAGSQEVHSILENMEICSNHNDCEARRAQIKMTKGFVAKESVKGHMASSFFYKFKIPSFGRENQI